MNLEYLTSNKNNIIEGPFLFHPNIFKDDRGYFFESWNKKEFEKLVSNEINFIQDNQSLSNKNVLRGLHFQLEPKAQSKLVKVVRGSVNDVIVDLRLKSPTFMEWSNVKLSCKKNNQLWIPKGFAHGFLTLEDNTILQYKVDNYWCQKHEKTLIWNDEELNIKWSRTNTNNDHYVISNKDKNGLLLKDLIKDNYIFT